MQNEAHLYLKALSVHGMLKYEAGQVYCVVVYTLETVCFTQIWIWIWILLFVSHRS